MNTSTSFEPMLPKSTSCKCCDAEAPLFDVCDFAKNCHDKRAPEARLSGIPIYYYRCGSCGFLFTTQFDAFSREDFFQYIYNDDYVQVDPDYVDLRPRGSAEMIERSFGRHKESLRILDYGGGNGLMAKVLKEKGFSCVETYDPFVPGFEKRPEGSYSLIFSAEVVEHSPTPHDTFQDMHSFLDQDEGLILFTTLVQPPQILSYLSNWWYVGPRNGHCSIHTDKSLAICLEKLGLKYSQLNQNVHLAFEKTPSFFA